MRLLKTSLPNRGRHEKLCILLTNRLKRYPRFCHYHANGSIIMSYEDTPLRNQMRRFGEEQGWFQREPAERAGLSRAGVSAIEIGKPVPTTVAALALAKVFGCRVEELFQLGGEGKTLWVWPPSNDPAVTGAPRSGTGG
jgi:DNA-binding XRE family transcriptional regulator